MDSKLKLFGELCEVLDIRSTTRLNNVLKKYHINEYNNSISFNEALDKYIEAKELYGTNKSTTNHYIINIKKFGKMFNFKPVDQYTKDDIRESLKLRLEVAQPQTVYVFHNIIKNFFDWLVEEKYINENPFLGVNYKHVKTQRHFIKDEDVKKIKKSCNTLFEKLIIEFLLSTGCRLSEVPKIKITDCDFKTCTCKVTGKGNKTRTVMFNNTTKKLLKEHMSVDTDKTHLICLHNKSIRGGDITKVVKDTSKRANVPNVCAHMYRHTFATNCLSKGMDITSIQRLLGHSDISTTQIYAETSLDLVKSEYKKVFKNEFWYEALLWTCFEVQAKRRKNTRRCVQYYL